MARMMIKFEALRDAKEVFECSNGSKLVNLWVQDLDDSKLKLGLTAFDKKDGTYLVSEAVTVRGWWRRW